MRRTPLHWACINSPEAAATLGSFFFFFFFLQDFLQAAITSIEHIFAETEQHAHCADSRTTQTS